MNNLQNISDQELLNELKRRLSINNKDNNTPKRENNILVGRMENRPERSEYKLLGKILGLYENQPQNLLSFEQKEIGGSTCLFSFMEVFKEYREGLDFNEKEKKRITLIFDAKRFNNNLEPIKEKLKAGKVIGVFGRLNNTINQQTGGRSFSVYYLINFPEKVIEFK
jgi:hypothetical protein